MTSWLNRSVGVAARNGTSSHTISFTAASSGSLLVVLVGGSVTNTMSTGGYTKRLGPVNNTELSVFTKTASAGESSFTVTHNASDYAVNYAVYEFASGSIWFGGTSSANASTWPTLSSLTGTLTVFGALSELKLTGDSGYSGTATAPWVEDVDSDVPQNVTEGDWFYVLFQDGYTSATATPVETDNSGRTDERVVFAITVAAGAAAPAFVQSRSARPRPLPARRARTVPAPIRPQLNPPMPPTPPRAVRAQRGLLPRRSEVAQLVPAQQSAVQTPALTQRVTRTRVQALLARLRQRGDLAPPQDPPQPPTPRPGRCTRPGMGRRSEVATPVPTQVAVQPPSWPPSMAKTRRWWALARRAEVATPVPPQVVPTPPAYPPAPVHSHRFATPARRGRAASPTPGQAAVQPPAYPPAPARRRRIATGSRRGRVNGPPAQVPAVPQIRALQRRLPTRARRTGIARPPASQAVQIAPPWIPVAVRGLRRVAAIVRRTRPGGWLFGGTGITVSRGHASITGRTGSAAATTGRTTAAANTTGRDTAAAHIEEV